MPGNPFYRSPEWRALRKACFDRDGWRCAITGCNARAIVADHVRTRPPVPYLTPFDTLANLRSLCAHHDALLKELPGGVRRHAGDATAKGCDADGWPRSAPG